MKSLGKSVQMIYSNAAKMLHLKPKTFSLILGLIVIIFLALGLGRQNKREGFINTSDAKNMLASIIDAINGSINIIAWPKPEDKQNLKKNSNCTSTRVSTDFYRPIKL